MMDPLAGFDWSTLHLRYRALCCRFKPRCVHPEAVSPAPETDLSLYYWLVRTAGPDASGERRAADTGWYKALLYWKLYFLPSTPSNIARWLPKDGKRQQHNTEQLRLLLAKMPRAIPHDLKAVTLLLGFISEHPPAGMSEKCALAVRSTFLHFLYPAVVPIFDKMVRKAVGLNEKDQSLETFRRYVLHAWALTHRHAEQLAGFRETPVRLTDMALWVIGHRSDRA
jgi:hypothetical protein